MIGGSIAEVGHHMAIGKVWKLSRETRVDGLD